MFKKSALFLLITSALAVPIFVHAQGGINMIWSSGECDQLGTNGQKLCTILWKVQEILYAAGIGLGAIMIIIGGITYATARDNEEQVKKARRIIINGLIGMVIVFAFALILGFVRDFVAQNLT